MGDDRAIISTSREQKQMGKAGTGGCSVILCRKRLQMAKSAPRFSTVYNSSKFLLCCNPKRTMGKNPRSVGGTSADRRRAEAGPSYAIIDSQSVKTTSAAEERGIDGGKKQKDVNGTS